MLTPTGWVIVILTLALGSTYGYMRVKQSILVDRAREAGRAAGLKEAQAAINVESLETVRKVLEGEKNAERVDPQRAKLIELCKRSASCRDRGVVK